MLATLKRPLTNKRKDRFMAARDLTAQRLRSLVDYNPESGVFTWKDTRRGKVKIGDIAGGKTKTGYWCISIDGLLYGAHRLAWLHTHGSWPTCVIDHINCIPSDNRLKNLRDVSHSLNAQNQRRARIDNETGVLGVKKTTTGRYKASIGAKLAGTSVKLHLGTYDSADKASAIYSHAKLLLHPLVAG